MLPRFHAAAQCGFSAKLVSAFVPVATCLAALSAGAVPITYTDLSAYNAAVGSHTIIDFQGMVDGTPLANQYAAQGLTFSDGDDSVHVNGAFVADGIGFRDGGGFATLLLSSPQNHFGVEFPGALRIQLYDGATLVFSGDFGSSGSGFFGGVFDSDATFNRVVISDPADGAGFYDNLHFGVVPEPSTALLVAGGLALLTARRAAGPRM